MQAMPQPQEISLLDLPGIFLDGLKLSLSKECRPFVIIPLIINFFVLIGLSYLMIMHTTALINDLTGGLPGVLEFLLSTILVLSSILAGCYIFSTVATWIASPFYGILADCVEKKLTGKNANDDTLLDVFKDIPRIVKREVRKQIFFLPRALLCLIIFIIPGVNLIFPVLWFLLTAWMACIQYCDYAFDNHKITFEQMRKDLAANRLATFCFGAVIVLVLTIPIFNLIVPPAAVCAGTKYYLKVQEKYTLA